MDRKQIAQCLEEWKKHLNTELLPFWLTRCKDDKNGGFITQFDKDGKDTGEDAKSLIAQTRCTYTFSAAHRAGYGGGQCAEFARHGADYLIDRMRDKDNGGFYWMTDRKGKVSIDKKVVYGQSFAIYALSEYTLATGDPRGLEHANRTFELLQTHAADTLYGGYFEMFERDWTLCGPGSAGGDRKTLDAHMHLMEAFTTLYECSRRQVHRRKLLEVIGLLMQKILHPQSRTGIPQFWADWTVAPQIKFDIIWGWDRFAGGGEKKANPTDNTSYGHNLELMWLLLHALDILGEPIDKFADTIRKIVEHADRFGIDREHGGVFVEGSHNGPAWDLEKEFWQQAESLIALLDATLVLGPQYWKDYENVHRFVHDKMIHHTVGEWWPLMTREGKPIWTHMSHSWKINYHTVRSTIQSIRRLEKLLAKTK